MAHGSNPQLAHLTWLPNMWKKVCQPHISEETHWGEVWSTGAEKEVLLYWEGLQKAVHWKEEAGPPPQNPWARGFYYKICVPNMWQRLWQFQCFKEAWEVSCSVEYRLLITYLPSNANPKWAKWLIALEMPKITLKTVQVLRVIWGVLRAINHFIHFGHLANQVSAMPSYIFVLH